MHILKGQARGLEAAGEPVDLEQSPGAIVILSAADTELSGLAAARRRLGEDFPSVRLANWMALAHPYSVDLYAEKVLAQAQLVVIRLLGGASYWRYGLDEAVRLARANRTKLAVVPGDSTWDPTLAAEGTLDPDEARMLWSYLVEGGAENLARALQYCAYLIDAADEPGPAETLPTAGFHEWRPPGQAPQSPHEPEAAKAAIVFYRALVQAGQTEPVDALCAALADRGLRPLPLFVSSLKQAADSAFVAAAFAEHRPDVVLNATAFSISEPGRAGAATVLDGGERPVLQVTFSGVSEEAWASSTRGLSPADLTMNVVLPEIDGRIVTRSVSFKEAGERDPLTECRPMRHRPKPDRIAFAADLAAAWARLRRTPNAEKRVAIVLANYPNGDGRIANGVGLDAPASTARLLAELSAAGFDATGAPRTGRALMERLLAGPTNARKASPRRGDMAFGIEEYARFFKGVPPDVQTAVEERWGEPCDDPFVRDGAFVLPAHRFGNVVVGIQPARGYNIDPKATYHDPDLVPPHGYFALYGWLRHVFGVDALVHMGKHGNLEWLPGKALALSEKCFPEAVLGPLPVIYPFIVNDPGEGAQAKRRSAAVIVDHLMPPMARAESHGAAAALEALIDEYAAAEAADPRRAKLVAARILDLARAHGFDHDLGLAPGADTETALAKLDEHICDLKEMQIRDGLHVLGEAPQARQRAETLVALARVPRGSGRDGDASLLRALADDLDLGFDPLDCGYSELWTGPRPDVLRLEREASDPSAGKLGGDRAPPWRTKGDTVERLESLALRLVSDVNGAELPAWAARTRRVLQDIRSRVAPALDGSGEREIRAVLDALAGRFVPPGPSGAPTRGRADCLPTGRNFYSVDVRAVPTPAAWDLGRRSADMLAERYFQDEGEWPKAIALTVWGTSNMRTGGDDIAQALALIGTRPVWEPASGRVTGIEVVPLSELGRPRVDVTLRISGFFRDAFPAQIALFHEAVQAVAERDEPADANPIAARIRADAERLTAAGLSGEAAGKAASFRVFGSKPGAYGAGLQALIDEGIWRERKDLAASFLEWSAYAYGGGAEGEGARDLLETRLATVDAVVQNQDNREHDLLDSDDYYQFEGGLSAAVETLSGAAPRVFHNDHSRPERPVIRALEEEVARVVRGRAANPKWIAGVMRHGYKGAFEIAATVDYLFAFAATTNAVRHHHFDQLYDAYLADGTVRGFIAENNPPALKEIASRFREAVDRGLWAPRRNSTYEDLLAMTGSAP
ncbi:cobaltochelatase subunit CobN [Faunimonas sp. B44]|uniref:cobaltochelatase subunit CobN n=1 Tax=Faunimonas sp. B44 TaxID=3461493 RepID=UPI004043C0B7